MARHWTGILGAALLLLGFVGLVFLAYAGGMLVQTPVRDSSVTDRAGRRPLSAAGASLGARVYVDGTGEDGRAIPRTANGPGMMGGGCIRCHGIDGSGGRFRIMMGEYDVPDIRYSALTGDHEHGGAPWTDSDIMRAVTQGVEPDGQRLDPLMPRWDLTAREFEALLDYLKELDRP